MPAYQFDWDEFMAHKRKWGTIRDFENKKLLPFNKSILEKHLMGIKTLWIYPLLKNNSSHFIVADFDGDRWIDDSRKFLEVCEANNISAYLERSRSWNGGHVWIFFADEYPAVKSRKIFLELLRKVFSISEFQKDFSFDRLFPNQDYLSKEGFGNLIAVPLQWKSARSGNSLFIDPITLNPYDDQFQLLENITRISTKELDRIYDRFSDIPISKNSTTYDDSINGKIEIYIRNFLFIRRSTLSGETIAFIKDNLNFANPEYLIKKRMGRSVYQVERYFNLIGEQGEYIFLPRGFLSDLTAFLTENSIEYRILDERKGIDTLGISSNIKLYSYQEKVIQAVEKRDNGIIVAPPGSGKTIMALKIIEGKSLPALIIVHRRELLDQWKERIIASFWYSKEEIWQIGWGKNIIWKSITIAMIQWLSKMKNISEISEKFGTIIVDECHHIPAKTFRNTISNFTSKFLYGFTATPKRKNHDEKLIYAYIWTILIEISKDETLWETLKENTHKIQNAIIIRDTSLFVPFSYKNDQYEILSKILIFDTERNKMILEDLLTEIWKKRKILLLTERKEHAAVLHLYLKNTIEAIVLTGDDSARERKRKMNIITSWDFQILISTGQFLWEGIDIHSFETLFLVYPFSFEGKLVQYMGRVGRWGSAHTVYDYRDRHIEYLEKLFKKRKTHYNKLVKTWNYSLNFL